jgi:MYXO-CTERM domain-containing protein
MGQEARMIRRFLATALVLAAAGCGAGVESGIEHAAIAGEPMVVELGGPVRAVEPLPDGAAFVGERLEWTPAAGDEGEHLISFEVLRGESYEPMTLRVSVEPGDGSIQYGGCDCGARPNPPRPKAEALGALLLAVHFRRRRRAA